MLSLSKIGRVFALVAAAAAVPLERCRLLDLTHSFDAHTVYWPGAQSFNLTVLFNGTTEKGFYYTANAFSAAEHGGTHLDAPVHFALGRQTAEQIPLSNLIGEACVVDVRAKAANDRDYQLSEDDLEAWEEDHGTIDSGCILLVRTGWDKFWPNKTAYLGHESDATKLHFPGIHPDTAKWLVKERPIRAVGLDTASLDFGQSALFTAHQVFFDANIPGFENLMNLDQLPERGATLVAMPMKIAKGSGGPLRAFAFGFDGKDDPCRRAAAAATALLSPLIIAVAALRICLN